MIPMNAALLIPDYAFKGENGGTGVFVDSPPSLETRPNTCVKRIAPASALGSINTNTYGYRSDARIQ
jgi:hypothetical protein